MNVVSQKVMRAWAGLGTRFLPFADAATPDLPLSRLLRLSLIQVSVGMSLVLLIGTLNRVMIVELAVPASLVGIMLSLPLVFAPFRALIGFRSDTHKSVLGWRRVPFIYRGTMVQFGGLAIMPFALLVLSGTGNASSAPAWVGQLGAGLAFLLVGIGIHTTQTIGLALATDQATLESQPKVVGLMYVMLLFGTIGSALFFGALLADFTPGRLVQVIQGSAVVTIVLNAIALWKQETRHSARVDPPYRREPSFTDSWGQFIQGSRAMRRLTAVGLGTLAFSMEDVLLEPYGGQILHLTVGNTTKLTATLAIGGLFGFGLASRVLSRGADPFRMASYGALVGIPAFAAVILSGPSALPFLFGLGTLLIGFGGGLFGHGTLTATMNLAPKDQAGLALGAWGAVQASAAGIGIALGGIARDLVGAFAPETRLGPAAGYDLVYGTEIMLLVATLVTMLPLVLEGGVRARAGSYPGSGSIGNRTESGGIMTTSISRMYATPEQARSAYAEAREFVTEDVYIVASDEVAPSFETIVDALVAGYVLKAHAKIYAEGILRGGSLVTVHPPFSAGVLATEILDSHDPIDSGVEEPKSTLTPWDEATPISCALQLPVLLDESATFSAFWNLPVLARSSFSFSALMGFPLLSKEIAPLSSLIGLPLLSKNATPLSSLLKLPILR